MTDQPRPVRMTEHPDKRPTPFTGLLDDTVQQHRAALKADADKRLRAALEAEGVDPDAVARVAARYERGEL